jgi:hypothetical protein
MQHADDNYRQINSDRLLATAQLRRHDAASGISGFRAWLYRHVVVATVMAAAVWVFAGLVVGYIWAG